MERAATLMRALIGRVAQELGVRVLGLSDLRITSWTGSNRPQSLADRLRAKELEQERKAEVRRELGMGHEL